jgi:hypothetical protein
LLDINGVGVAGRTINIELSLDGGASWGPKASPTTDGNGFYSYEYAPPNKGLKSFRSVFAGDGTYDPSTSPTIQVNVLGMLTTLTIDIVPKSGVVPFNIVISGLLTETATGAPIASATVRLHVTKPDGTTDVITDLYTDVDGHYLTSPYSIATPGNYTFWTSFEGDFWYEGCLKEATMGAVTIPWIPIAIGIGVPSLLIALYYLTK